MNTPLQSAPSHRLRILTGPLEGIRLPVHSHFLIGRSDETDLQLMGEHVSREHAEVVRDPAGHHWLVDRNSHNGTLIEEQPIQRALLSPGVTFTIDQTTFVFETDISTRADDQTVVISHRAAHSQRRCSSDQAPPGRPRRSRPSPDDVRLPVVSTYVCGLAYSGNVLDDIMAYRAYRLRVARDELAPGQDFDHFARLSGRLLLPFEFPNEPRKLYARMSCCLPATLRRPSGEAISASMLDVSVNGAQLCAHNHDLQWGDRVWLTLELARGQRLHHLVIGGRVAWASRHHLGLCFSRLQPLPGAKTTWPTVHRASAPRVAMPAIPDR